VVNVICGAVVIRQVNDPGVRQLGTIRASISFPTDAFSND
jgi:hypothetical protein